MNIRFAKFSDLETIIDIYNQAIASGCATADLIELTAEDRLDWFNDHDKDSYPIYVIEKDNSILGWGSLSAYRKGRGALRTTAEISYYIDYNHHGKGLGKKLIEHMVNDCERLGFDNLVAILLEINYGSINILKHFGFEQWGLMPNIAILGDQKCGHLYYGIKLTD